MQADLTNAVKNYKKSTIYDAVNEAIVNSIQANATKIEIQTTPRDANELLAEEHFSSIIIKDNGDGFNQKNRQSFLTYLSRYKENYGCKGIGRLSYLKTFNKVHISSKQNSELVSFNFTTGLSKETLKPKEIANCPNETIITLEQPINNENYNPERLYHKIYNHIYPLLFLHNRDCEIVINNDKKITKDDVLNIENIKFNVVKKVNNLEESAEFNLWYRFKESEKAIIDDFLCANNRMIERFSSKKLQLKINKKTGCQITFLLESDWINQNTNQFHEVENVNDGEEEEYPLFPEISWKDVRKELSIIINQLLNKQFPELEEENKRKISDLKEKYPHYADYINNNNIGFIDEKQALDYAYKQTRIEEEKLNDKNVSIADIRKCVSNDLTRYVLHRQKIIDKLQELKNTHIEKEIHNLFLQQGLEGQEERQVPLDKNNLWLLDDKFMSYSYIASEKAISTFLKNAGLEKNGSNEEMDIVLYSDNQKKKRAVILEMKKLTANYKENGTGISQLFNYCTQLYEAGIKEFYLYLIAEIDDKFRLQLTSERLFKKVFSHEGEIYQNSYNDFNAYIQIISPDAIISDAMAKNKTFLDIIKKSKR